MVFTDQKVHYEMYAIGKTSNWLDDHGTEQKNEKADEKVIKGGILYSQLAANYKVQRIRGDGEHAFLTLPDGTKAKVSYVPANVLTSLCFLAKDYRRRYERRIDQQGDQQSAVPLFAGFRNLLWGCTKEEVKQRIKPETADAFAEAELPTKFWNNLWALDRVSLYVIKDRFRFWDNKDTFSDRKLAGFPMAPDLTILLVKERDETTWYYFVDNKLYIVEVEPRLADVNGSDLLANLGAKYGICEKRSSDHGRAVIYHWSNPKGIIKAYCSEPGSGDVRLSDGEYLGTDGSKHEFTTFFVADLPDGLKGPTIPGFGPGGEPKQLELPLHGGAILSGRIVVLQYQMRPEYSPTPTSEFLRPPKLIDSRGNIYEEYPKTRELVVGWKSAGSTRVQDVRNGSGVTPPPLISVFQVPTDATDLRISLPDKTLLYLPLYEEQFIQSGAIETLLPQKSESQVKKLFYGSTEVQTYVQEKLNALTKAPDSETERKRHAKEAADKL